MSDIIWSGWAYCDKCDRGSPCFRTVHLAYLGDAKNPTNKEVNDYGKTWLDNNPRFSSCIVNQNRSDSMWRYVKYDQIPGLFTDNERVCDFARMPQNSSKNENNKPKGRFADIELI